MRLICGSLAILSWGLTTLATAPLWGSLSNMSVGLTNLDERCTQRWIEPPTRVSPPWDTLLVSIKTAGGRDGNLRVGAIRWPVPPCKHQTTHDLGEHLRVRARRAGLEAWVGAGEGWTEERWTSEGGVRPQLLIHDGFIQVATWRAACGRDPREVPVPIAVMRHEADDWPLELVIYECAR